MFVFICRFLSFWIVFVYVESFSWFGSVSFVYNARVFCICLSFLTNYCFCVLVCFRLFLFLIDASVFSYVVVRFQWCLRVSIRFCVSSLSVAS